jgi:hypothetical protein
LIIVGDFVNNIECEKWTVKDEEREREKEREREGSKRRLIWFRVVDQ